MGAITTAASGGDEFSDLHVATLASDVIAATPAVVFVARPKAE
jgi:hypothetical protein